MNNLRHCIFILVLFTMSISRGDIYNANSIEEINNTLMELLEKRNALKTLTILPLEGFILKPVDPAFHVYDQRFSGITYKVFQKAKLSKKDYIKELTFTEYEHQLSDSMVVDFFKNLQRYNAPFIVVTPNSSGSFNDIPYLETWTWEYLLKKGIDLSKSPLGLKQILFTEGREKVKGTYPTFYRGLLSANFSGGRNSSQELIANLLVLHLNWTPDIVYIVDSSEDYIKSIEQQLKSVNSNIQVVGFVYAPQINMSDQITPKEFSVFWGNFVDKLNSVSRKEIGNENPYEQ